MTTRHFLVADIGGTHARFSLAHASGGTIEIDTPATWLTALYNSLDAALAEFLKTKGNPHLDGVAVCAAGPIEEKDGDRVIVMTNCPWAVSRANLSRVTGVARPLLMNDFAAQALAIPHLRPETLHKVGGGAADVSAPIAVLGAGTGLGVASLVPMPGALGKYIVVDGEGGHVDLAPTNAREIAILHQLMQEHGRVSAERVLSGPGLVALYMALGALSGAAEKSRPSPVDIFTRARNHTSPICEEAVEVFCGWLGSVAGNLALTLGAAGGVYIGGGIVPGWIAESTSLFNEKLFRYRFEAKGRFKPYLAAIPVYVIMREDPALLGLAHAAMNAAG